MVDSLPDVAVKLVQRSKEIETKDGMTYVLPLGFVEQMVQMVSL